MPGLPGRARAAWRWEQGRQVLPVLRRGGQGLGGGAGRGGLRGLEALGRCGRLHAAGGAGRGRRDRGAGGGGCRGAGGGILGQKLVRQQRCGQQCGVQCGQSRQAARAGRLLRQLGAGLGQGAGAGQGAGNALADFGVQDGVAIQAGQGKGQQGEGAHQPPLHGFGPGQQRADGAEQQQPQALGGGHVEQGGRPQVAQRHPVERAQAGGPVPARLGAAQRVKALEARQVALGAEGAERRAVERCHGALGRACGLLGVEEVRGGGWHGGKFWHARPPAPSARAGGG